MMNSVSTKYQAFRKGKVIYDDDRLFCYYVVDLWVLGLVQQLYNSLLAGRGRNDMHSYTSEVRVAWT